MWDRNSAHQPVSATLTVDGLSPRPGERMEVTVGLSLVCRCGKTNSTRWTFTSGSAEVVKGMALLLTSEVEALLGQIAAAPPFPDLSSDCALN